MKIQHKYLALSLAAALTMGGISLAALSSAQTVTPLTCSVGTSTVVPNQSTILTASGGDGVNYTWSGPNLNSTNPTGNQFSVSYPNPGTYTVTVASAGLTSNCSFTVVPATTTTTGALSCSPATQDVTLGQVASVSASGGNGTYVWSSPDLTITNVNGSGFSANFGSTGLKTLTVSSGGVSSNCMVNVLAGTTPVTTPGLPNTGGGYGQQ